MIIERNVWKFGDDVNTDVIYPGKYVYILQNPDEMAMHALEGLDPEFAGNVQENDIIVAGKNFGCGSSREQAAACLKYAKVGAVVARSFGRIFFRNAINAGLPVIRANSTWMPTSAATACSRGNGLIEPKRSNSRVRFSSP